MSPRRSSRARTTQPPPAPPTHTNSSTSLNSLPRAERNARSNQRQKSPRRSLTRRSESSDHNDITSRAEPRAPRRSRRGNDNDEKDKVKRSDEEEETEALEEEITRCVCGQSEYPGLSDNTREERLAGNTKPRAKDENAPVKEMTAPDLVLEEAGNFFIQCDDCHVWQHGGCIGLMDETMSPDFYYCEQCRPGYHKVTRASNG